MKEHGMFIVQSATGYILVDLNAFLFRRLGPMVFQNQPQMFQMLPEPFNTLGKLAAISCPTLVMHGDKDNYLRFADGPLSNAKFMHTFTFTFTWFRHRTRSWAVGTSRDCWCRDPQLSSNFMCSYSSASCLFVAALLVNILTFCSPVWTGRDRSVQPSCSMSWRPEEFPKEAAMLGRRPVCKVYSWVCFSSTPGLWQREREFCKNMNMKRVGTCKDIPTWPLVSTRCLSQWCLDAVCRALATRSESLVGSGMVSLAVTYRPCRISLSWVGFWAWSPYSDLLNMLNTFRIQNW